MSRERPLGAPAGPTRLDGRRLFGIDPAGYAEGRPRYPERIYEVLVSRCNLVPGTTTIEIGPGAGQATERLLELGADPLIAVEPDGALAAFLADRFGDRVRVHTVPFEEFDCQASTFSLAVSATAFHWIDRSRGLSQVAKTLQPGGWWAMWWTIYHDPTRTDPLYEALAPILGDLPRALGGDGRNGPAATFALDRAARRRELKRAGFDKIKIETVRWKLDLDPACARALFATFSPVLALPDDRRAATLGAIERVVADEFSGQVDRPVVTILYTAQRPGVGVSATTRGARL